MAIKVSKKLEKPPELPEPLEHFGYILEEEEEETGGFTPVRASEVEKEAPVVSPSTKTPEFPTKVIKAKDSGIFWDWLASLSDEDWTKVNVYVYRQWPIINKRLVDPSANTNIEKYMGSFTEQNLKESHGSGEYKLMVNDSSRTVGGKGGKVGEAYISINDPMYPPVLDVSELTIGHPQNRSYIDQLKREGKLDMNGNPAVQQGQQGKDTGATGELVDLIKELVRNGMRQQAVAPQKDNSTDAVIQMMAKTHEHSLNLVKDQIKGDDPEKLVKLMVAVAGLNKPDNSMEMFMKMQMEMTKLQSESANSREALMMKLFELTNKPKEDDFGKKLEQLMQLKELTGGGESEGGGGRKKWYEVAIENGAPVLNSIIQGITQFIAVKTQVDAQQRQAPQQGNMQHPTAVPQAIEEGNNVIEMPTQPKQPSPLIQYGGMVIAALQRGETGDKFASGVVRLIGPLAYKQIASVGKDAIITEMKETSQFWQHMAPYETILEEFVTDFVECGGEEFMEEEGTENA